MDVRISGSDSASGSYTPTFTLTANLLAATAPNPVQWSRDGKIVTVFGRITAQAAGAGATLLDMTLPFASVIGAVDDFSGVGWGLVSPSPSQVAQVNDNIANSPNTAQFLWSALDAVSHAIRFTYTYRIQP